MAKKVIVFEVGTSDFTTATELCELAYGYEGELWNYVKKSGDFDELADFLQSDDVDAWITEGER